MLIEWLEQHAGAALNLFASIFLLYQVAQNTYWKARTRVWHFFALYGLCFLFTMWRPIYYFGSIWLDFTRQSHGQWMIVYTGPFTWLFVGLILRMGRSESKLHVKLKAAVQKMTGEKLINLPDDKLDDLLDRMILKDEH